MSGEFVLRMQPGETAEEFTCRVVDTARPLTSDAASRLRVLLPIRPAGVTRKPSRRTARAAA
jgi:hypothetical protein